MRHSERLALIGKIMSKLRALSDGQSPCDDTKLLAICAIWQLATTNTRPTYLQGSQSDLLLLHVLRSLQPDLQPLSSVNLGVHTAANNKTSNRKIQSGQNSHLKDASGIDYLTTDDVADQTDGIDNTIPGATTPAPLQDNSNFAQICTDIASKLVCTEEELSLLCEFFTKQDLSQYGEIFEDPCLMGWIYQLTLKKKSSDSHSPRSLCQEEIGKATQWFTPDWIADFLVDETITTPAAGGQLDPNAVRFLDPACGAGHILVKAFGQLIRMHQARGDSLDAAISAALRQTFGLDIDPHMLHLTAFSLYVAIRQQLRTCGEFPTPNLFIVSTTSGEQLGSLLLKQSTARHNRKQIYLLNPLSDEILDIDKLPKAFTAIATNPPYLGHRTMPDELTRYLIEHYPNAKYDLYAAFLTLSTRLLESGARLSLICQQSFLSIQRYQNFRDDLNGDCDIEAIALLGSGTFLAKPGEKTNNVIITLRKRTLDQDTSASTLRCWQMLSAGEKLGAESVGLKNKPANIVSYSRVAKASTSAAPLLFLHPLEVEQLFEIHPALESDRSGVACSNGLFTCDNKRFLKHFAEVPAADRHHYVPYDKGGGHKWFRTTPHLLLWENDGEEIRQFRKSRGQSRALPGEEYYFKPGVTYSYIGTRGFKARMLSPNSIFDIASSALFTDGLDINYLLGFLNSSLACYLLGILNPTINFQIGDLRRLPFKQPTPEVSYQVGKLAEQALRLAKRCEEIDPTSAAFDVASSASSAKEAYATYVSLSSTLSLEEQKLQTEIDHLILDLYTLSGALRTNISADPWVSRSRQLLVKIMPFKRFEHSLAERNRITVPVDCTT